MKMLISISISLISILGLLTIYGRFFMFPSSISKNIHEAKFPAIYTDKYLSEEGFKISDRHEQYFSLSKKDTFNFKIGQKTFTDLFEMEIHSSDEYKPIYINTTFNVNSKVDSNFMFFLNLKEDSVLNGKLTTKFRNENGTWEDGYTLWKESFFTISDSLKFIREVWKEPKGDKRIKYWLFKNEKFPKLSFFENSILYFVKFFFN